MKKYIVGILSAIILAMPGAHAWAAAVYKCKNQQGEMIYQESPCKQDLQPVSSWAASTGPVQQDIESSQNVGGVLIIKQSGNGHYFVEGTINGKPLTFVVDTGASTVALPREVAMSAQIYCRENVLVQTANGSASACTTVIARLKFGPFLIKDTTAMISPNLGQPLLGMSVLQQFKIEQDQGVMRISIRD